MSTPLGHHQTTKLPADISLLGRLTDLFHHKHWGNMGPELYKNGGARRFENILTSSYRTYFAEQAMIRGNLPAISAWAKETETAIIIGPGPSRSVISKELPVLEALPNLKRVVLIELSPEFNRQSSEALSERLDSSISVSSYTQDFRTVDLSGIDYESALVISTGAFTNFEDTPNGHFPHAQFENHLEAIKRLAKKGGQFLWGYDSSLDPRQYNNDNISNFLLYPLQKASNMEETVLDASGFRHMTYADQDSSSLSHAWVVTKDQDVTILDQSYAFSKGEKFVSFTSAKLSPNKTQRSAFLLGVTTNEIYSDTNGTVIHTFDCR